MAQMPKILLDTVHGEFEISTYSESGRDCMVIAKRPFEPPPIVRFHSSCVFSESLDSVDCDCASQLRASLDLIGRSTGVVIYAWDEGRGAGITKKIEAIALERANSIDTAEAFERLGLTPDPRGHELQINALKSLKLGNDIRLVTANPAKIQALQAAGFTVERVKLRYEKTEAVQKYLEMKRRALGHFDDDEA